MTKIGIIFGTDSGYTRKTAKLIAKTLGKARVPDKPININRVDLDTFLSYDLLILGTPTYGEGILPGIDTGIDAGSWTEFLPQLPDGALEGKTVALFGFGDQKRYKDSYVSGMGLLYDALKEKGATFIGDWPVDGYEFSNSNAVRDGRFVGLALDDENQGPQTAERVSAWLESLGDAVA